MRPDDSRPTNPIIPKRPYLRPEAERTRPQVNDAAANVVRNQIDTIYQAPAKKPAVVQPLEQADVNPYDRTHQQSRTEIHAEQWKKYHSAWQDYYRQYYERYYLGELYRMRQALENRIRTPGSSEQLTAQSAETAPDTQDVMYDLKSKLLSRISTSAMKVRRSNHFVPLMAALMTMVIFILVSANPYIFGIAHAYVSPGNVDPANIITDPNVDVPVGPEPKLIIPKINIDVPVIYDTSPDQASQLKAMQQGVAWFGIPGANSHPGQKGNTVIAGHSSNDIFDPGDYKFIFARLEQLSIDDTFYLNYEGKRFTYNITKKEVVRPTDVGKLIYETDKPIVTLITCVPVGTAQSRLLVTAEQVSPDPSKAKPAPSTNSQDSDSTPMPGNSPTILNRIFGS